MNDIAYQRAQDTLRALLNLPPAEQLVSVQPVIVPSLDVLAIFDARDQQFSNTIFTDVAPGAQQQTVVIVPPREIWMLDAISVSVAAPATSGDAVLNANVTMNRNGIAGTITVIDTENTPGSPGLMVRRGALFRPPLFLHPGDEVIGRVINRAGNVGNAVGPRLQFVYRELESRAL